MLNVLELQEEERPLVEECYITYIFFRFVLDFFKMISSLIVQKKIYIN